LYYKKNRDKKKTFSKGGFIVKETNVDVVIIGGGLAGLTSAALLAKKGKKVALLEKGKVGGRAITANLKGFTFNFGAHAIYGKDVSIISVLEKELNLHIEWKSFNQQKAIYDLGDELSVIPTNLKGLRETKMITGNNKGAFAWQVLLTLAGIAKGEKGASIGEWLNKQSFDNEIKEMLLTLASSNFFTSEPENIPSNEFFAYYKRLFKTKEGVSYIKGGWTVLINELVRVIKENKGEVYEKAKVTMIEEREGKINTVFTTKEMFTANEFIFCIPPAEIQKLMEQTPLKNKIKPYTEYESTYVMFYDLGLEKRIESEWTYVYDKEHKLFVTDISYYDPTCVPEGGQLLQCIAYLTKEEIGDEEVFETKKKQIEELYDKHYRGWRDVLVVSRISKKAVVQEIKWNMNQLGMPGFFEEMRNVYFAGDWCKGQGQLSELSFSSAYEAVQKICKK
jgi:phytoene dehydrogenase-like protein